MPRVYICGAGTFLEEFGVGSWKKKTQKCVHNDSFVFRNWFLNICDDKVLWFDSKVEFRFFGNWHLSDRFTSSDISELGIVLWGQILRGHTKS